MNNMMLVALLSAASAIVVDAQEPIRLRKQLPVVDAPSFVSGLEYDQEVARLDHLLFGEHNLNGGFTVNRNNGIEIGLRTKLTFPVIENEYNSNGDSTYSWDRVDCIGEPIESKIPHWSMEFSVSTDQGMISDYCWELGMDADPSDETDFTSFDPISRSETAAFFDHSFGTAGVTGESNSINRLSVDCTSSLESAQICAQYYEELLATYNVAQNYWNFGFVSLPGTSLYYFDRAVTGNYVVYLRAIDCKGTGHVLAESHVQILVGSAKKVDNPRLPDATEGGYQMRSRFIGCPLNSNLEFGQDVMPSTTIIDAPNGGFTTDRRNGLEIGLRTRQRFSMRHEQPAANFFHDNGGGASEGDGVYWWARSSHCTDKVAPCTHTPQWTLDLAVNVNVDGMSTKTVGDYCWEMGIDGDPSSETNFFKFDPMNPSEAFPFFNHVFGVNITTSANSIDDGTCTDTESCKEYYNKLLRTKSIAQNALNFDTFSLLGTPLEGFNSGEDGSYIVYLRAMDCKPGQAKPQIVAETFIQILVGQMYPTRDLKLPDTQATSQKTTANILPSSAAI